MPVSTDARRKEEGPKRNEEYSPTYRKRDDVDGTFTKPGGSLSRSIFSRTNCSCDCGFSATDTSDMDARGTGRLGLAGLSESSSAASSVSSPANELFGTSSLEPLPVFNLPFMAPRPWSTFFLSDGGSLDPS